jgi:hypothetical protein
MRDLAPLHPVSRGHLEALTDGVGIMQHAIGARPDPAHGHCTDDIARALQVDLLHARQLGWPAVAECARRDLEFISEAFDDATGRFRDFRSIDGAWADEVASEDCQGRALHALGDAIAGCPDPRLAAAAADLFDRALPAARQVTALRAQASVVLGCAARLGADPDRPTDTAFRLMAGRLRATFESRGASPWPWPEYRVTYENALPPRALIVAGRRLGSAPMVGIGLRVLDWLIDAQIAPDGHLSPVGNGWWSCDGERSRFDQQPIEATTLLLAAEAAYRATSDERYRAAVERAYGWFLGRNDLGLDVADAERGACHDGLTPHGLNANQGAESTLMWLTAAEHVRAIRGVGVAPQRGIAADRAAPDLDLARRGPVTTRARAEAPGVGASR